MLLGREHMKRDIIFVNIACQNECIINSYEKNSNGKIIKYSKYRHFGEIMSLIINIYNETVGNQHKRNMDILPSELCKRIGSDYVKRLITNQSLS